MGPDLSSTAVAGLEVNAFADVRGALLAAFAPTLLIAPAVGWAAPWTLPGVVLRSE